MRNILILSLCIFVAACSSKSKNEEVPENTISHYEPVEIVVGIGKIEPENGVGSLASDHGGIVQKVYLKTGDSFKAGDQVLDLRKSDASLKVAQVKTKITTGQQQIEADQIKIKELEAQLSNKINTLKISTDLAVSGAETQQKVNDLTNEKEVLQVQLENARKTVSLSRSRLSELQADLNAAQNELNLMTIYAPADGVLLEINAKEGGAIQSLQSFAEYALDEPLVVHGEVDELFATRLSLGMKADIKLMGNSQTVATGQVIYLSPRLDNKSLFSDMPGEAQDRRVRRFKIRIDNPGNLLLNTKVECEIKLK